MSIQVKFFASLRERIGTDQIRLDADAPLSVEQVWQTATQNADMPANTLCAVNMEYTSRDALANPGDEVAFFPPVTGG